MPEHQSPPSVSYARSRVGVLSRNAVASTPEQLADAKADLAEAKIAAAIKNALKNAPPLSDERAQRIAAILMAGGAADA